MEIVLVNIRGASRKANTVITHVSAIEATFTRERRSGVAVWHGGCWCLFFRHQHFTAAAVSQARVTDSHHTSEQRGSGRGQDEVEEDENDANQTSQGFEDIGYIDRSAGG